MRSSWPETIVNRNDTYVAGVPDKPEDVQVKEETPTLVVFTVTPPEEDGGNPITRYQVSYDSHTAEFARGELSLRVISSADCLRVCSPC